ncbi:hypothetical protein K9L67_04615 [Candidatus Woesearchaeota archaeon]|nr:hypothetical protein [Candidatus Woesearchaeota archaeon]MCF7901482.1 hypothetical protein [Candidatus Woesearchaeota archaeon]MCF8013185.1 hypothetical protein [Candidatus Woesearchaeota archaeon]
MNEKELILNGTDFIKLRSRYSNNLDENASAVIKYKFHNAGETFLLKQYNDANFHQFGVDILKSANKTKGNQHLISEDYFDHQKKPSLIFSYIEGTDLNSLNRDICYRIGQKLADFHEKTNLTHGDFHKGNIIKNISKDLSIIDIDLMGPRNFEHDIAMLLFYELIYQESNRNSILRSEVESLFNGYGNSLSNDLIKEEIENTIKVSEYITNKNLEADIFSESRVNYRKNIYESVRKKLEVDLFDAFNP